MYESYYGLHARPFQLSPDPKFFFGSRGHTRAKAYLMYGLHQGEGFIIITGDVGTGKTTLVRTLFAELAQQNVVAAQLVTTQLEAEEMLRMVSAAFGLAHEAANKASLLKNLETFLSARAREGKRVLLIVDEAQNLPAKSLEELRMLSNFQAGGRALLQCFLLGQEEFRRTLQSDGLEQLRQRVIASYHLAPLPLDETRAYIEHRLRLVGWREDPRFEPAAFEAIHRFTGGIPRRTNTLCDRLLLFGSLEDLHEITAETVAQVAAELLEETAQRPVRAVGESAEDDTGDAARPAPVGAAALRLLERRLASLENKLDLLQKNLREDQEHLCRFVLRAVLRRPQLSLHTDEHRGIDRASPD
jgi:general secretion pathway protein A